MTNLLQFVRSYWTATPAVARESESGLAMAEPSILPDPHPAERTRRYQTLIELRQLLHSFPEPARTTVVLVIDSQMTVHFPTLLARENFAFRLIVTSSEGYLLGAMSPGDLALNARGWGWSSVTYERGFPQALAAARESTAADEQLLVLLPSWLDLQA